MKKINVPETGGVPTQDYVHASKDNIDIITGRRGGRVALPQIQTLTFSDPPTQAQYQALNRYINAWALAMRALVTRIEG